MKKDVILSKAILNSISSVILVVFQGITYFLLYKFLLLKLGSPSLGLWSLIIATTSSANVANLGITNSLVPYIAEEHALDRKRNISIIISTGLLLMLGLITFVALLINFFGLYILEGAIPFEFRNVVQPLLNISCLNLIINSLSGVYLSSLEGLHKLFVRNIINIISSCILLISVFFLIDKYGLLGTVYAQLIQSLFILAASYYFLKKSLNSKLRSKIILQFNKGIAKKLLRTGYKYQIISFSLLFFDPLTKYLLSSFGGLSLVAYYEMANRLVTQFRSIIVMAGQSLIPMIANYKISGVEMKSMYANSFKLVFGMALALSIFLPLSSGFISILWIGRIELSFIIFVIVLSLGWFFNIISSPLYFINIGLNRLNGNLYNHILLFIMNIVFGFLLGRLYGGTAVIVGVSLSLTISSVFLILYTAKDLEVFLSAFFGWFEKVLIVALLLLTIIVLSYIETYSLLGIPTVICISVIIPALVFFVYAKCNPVFKELFLKVAKFKRL